MEEAHTSSSNAMRKVPVKVISGVIVQTQVYPRGATIFPRRATQTMLGQSYNKQVNDFSNNTLASLKLQEHL